MSTWVLECSLSSLGGLHKDESWSGCVSMYERLGGWWLLLLPRQPLSERQPLPRKCTLCHDPLRTGRFFIHCLGMFYFYPRLSVTWMWVRQHLWSMFFRLCFSPYSSQSFTCLVLNSLYVWKSMSSLFWSLDQFYSNVYVASPYLSLSVFFMLQYACSCMDDYHGNGTYCVPENVCTTNNGGCHSNVSHLWERRSWYYQDVQIDFYLSPRCELSMGEKT